MLDVSPTAHLEHEAITIIREVAAEFERPVLLFSGGKDSVVMLHLAIRAFAPARVPFPIMHVDTGHNFPELIEFRDRTVEQFGVELVVAVGAGLDRRRPGRRGHRAAGEPQPAADRHPARRASPSTASTPCSAVPAATRSAAGPRSACISHRDEFGQWDPKNQRPELWGLYNSRHKRGEHLRIFPLSNWTELDIWRFVEERDIELPDLYFAHHRDVFRRDGMLMAVNPFIQMLDGEESFDAMVRFRTIGDATCTAAVESAARHDRRRRRRDQRRPGHRARRHPRRRPDLGGGHGRPQASGLLLMQHVRSHRCASPPSAASTTASRP